jgi:uncharacterized glyoxalase superfamily protein PhnB
MPDPLDILRQPAIPIAPDAAFTARLRSRLVAALGLAPPGAATMSDTTVAGTPAYVSPGRRTLTPYISVHDTRAAIEWYREVLGAQPIGEVIVMDDGRVGHAEVQFGEVVLMLADEFPEIGVVSPRHHEGRSFSLSLFVPDVDATYALAIERGAEADRPPEDQFYGARAGWFVDPFGHRWSVQTALPAGAAPPMPSGMADTDEPPSS